MKRENEFLYLELASILRDQIHSGMIAPGQYLLSEKDMIQKYNVSRTSVRNVLKELLKEELVVKIQGKGTMVNPSFVVPEDKDNILVIMTPYPSSYSIAGLPILIRIFEQKYPGVQVKVLSIPHDPLPQNVIELGVDLDLVIMTDVNFRNIRYDDFAELDEFLEDLKDTPRQVVDAFKMYDNTLMAVPTTYSPIYLACNMDMFTSSGIEIPKSIWAKHEFIDAAKKMTKDVNGDGLIEVYGLAISSALRRWPALVLKEWLDFQADGHGEESTRSLVKAFDFIQNLIHLHHTCPAATVFNGTFSQELFEEGRIGMIPTSILAFKNRNLPFLQGIAPLPYDSNFGKLLIANGILLSKSSKKTELAKSFIQLALEPETQRVIADETGLLALYPEINRKIWKPNELEALGITDEAIQNSRFIHQMFSNFDVYELGEEMKWFWAGLENAAQMVNRIKILSNK